ncbi:MAG TPA: signal peptidase I [candidate division Zixibacteria bacterium]|nr:signal peptidase I [candidate division Zixibacteria bacterium]HBY99716.1 signal peptidase I [candidate division Zixibacteria bacterium]
MSLFSGKKPKKVKQNRTFLEVLWDYTQSLGVALILALMIKASVVEAYKIPSGSMEKTLLVGDFLLANKFVYGMRLPIPFTDIRLPALSEPKPGDIIIFKFPGDTRQNYIKRCIAVEGQKVKVVDKQVYVDDKPIPLPPHGQYADAIHDYPHSENGRWMAKPDGSQYWETDGNRDNMPEVTVPKGMLFMMGDNRDNSADSRYWGFLDRRLVQGKAMMIHWSWQAYDPTDSDVHFPRPPEIVASNPLSILQSVAFNIYHLPERVRWTRIGNIIK